MAFVLKNSIANETGITIAITERGRFDIADRKLDWAFRGRVGAPIVDVSCGRGCDRVGSYQQLAFAFEGPRNKARRGIIRLYDHRSIILFEHQFVDAGMCDEAFPIISHYPSGLHHLAYTGAFGGFSFKRFGADGPWCFFDDEGKSFVLSPASHFMNGALRHGSHGELRSELVCDDKKIPPGFIQKSVLALAPGINRAFDLWGRFLTDLAGKTRPANDYDVTLKSLGYWTDRGAKYYYHCEPGLGYGATLLKVRDAFREARIDLGYLEIDSWFYPKGRDGQWQTSEPLGGGTYLYEASREVFPEGLGAFQQKLGLPLITHNRWIDEHSPYRGKYKMSGDVAIDPALWSEWMRSLASSGVRTYEQDWLSGPAQPERTSDAGERFMDLMAEAAEREGITLQYCMPLPRHFLQGSKYANLTTIRTSPDRLTKEHWRPFLFNGRLATALGEWPCTDVFMSSETDNLLLATLSGGIVGIGDAIGKLDRDNLLRAVRPDGVIVKPDDPLTPLDRAFIAQAKDPSAPIIAVARTDHEGWVTSYVMAFGAAGNRRTQRLSIAELGYRGPVYAYDYFQKAGVLLDPDECLAIVISNHIAYWIVVPAAGSGIGFLGDQDKFVSNGRKRVSHISDNGVLSARIVLAKSEDRVRLHGFARERPEISARDGMIENMTYESSLSLFQFDLVSQAGSSPEIVTSIPRPR